MNVRTIKLVVLLGVLVGAISLITPYLHRIQRERQWMELQDACLAGRKVSCALLLSQVTPACTRDKDAIACYHMARVLDKGVSTLQDPWRVTSYYQLACRAGVRRACSHSSP